MLGNCFLIVRLVFPHKETKKSRKRPNHSAVLKKVIAQGIHIPWKKAMCNSATLCIPYR